MTPSAICEPSSADSASELLTFNSAELVRPSGAMKPARSSRREGPSGVKTSWAMAAMFPLLATPVEPAALQGGEAARSSLARNAPVIAEPVRPGRRRENTSVAAPLANLEVSISPTPDASPVVSRASDRASAAANAITAQDQVAAIQAALSLSVTEVAQVLRVARGTVYGWLKGSVPVPKVQADSVRLRELHRLAMRWRERTPETLSRLVAAPVGDSGISLLALLSAPVWDEQAIARTMEALAQHLESQAVENQELRTRGLGSPRAVTPENIELERLRLRGLG